jgi:S-DNA-T family DNA segregation ATPase FtsK/SpoIIIE
MAILSLFAGNRARDTRNATAEGAGDPVSEVLPRANVASGTSASRAPAGEPVFAPRRPAFQLPANTKHPAVIGAQPQTFARGREAMALLLWTFAVFLSLALASYAGDPQAVSPLPEGVVPVRGEDWVGPVGAFAARAFVGLVGLAAWVVPLEALLLGIPFVRGRRSNATPARMAGDVLMVIIGAALMQVGGPGKMAFGRHPAGGLVGELFGEVARSLFSTVGSFLVGFALIGLILIGRASFSFIALMRWFARLFHLSAERTASGARSVADAWAKARELDREREEERRRADEPQIVVPLGDEATILAGQDEPEDTDDPGPWDDGDKPSAPRLKVRAAPSEPFPEPSPIVLGGATSKDVKLDDAKKALDDDGLPVVVRTSKRARKKASLPPPALPALPDDGDDDDDDEPEASADEDGGPKSAPKRVRRGGGKKRDDVDASEEVAAAAGLHDAEDEDEEAPLAKLDVTPLEGLDVTAKKKASSRPPAKKPEAGITIVDTSAALVKDVPVTPPAPVEAPGASASAKKKTTDRRLKSETTFELPRLDMLTPAEPSIGPTFDEVKLRANAELLIKTLADYKIIGKVEEILPGPVVTTFEVSPVAGTKVSKVAALADDLALALAKKVRIVAPIPGKNRIGFELPNEKRVPVILRDLVEDRRFQSLDVPLPVVLGRDIVGNPVYADLASMPHAIVAGATGAGKSVGLNVMLTSLLFRRTPEELRMLMIDPKVVELAPYDRIPHMLLPVVTDMKQAATALKWAVDEMERRYQLFADAGTKNIGTYNGWVKRVLSGAIKNPLGKAIVGRDHNNLQEVLSVRFDDPEGEQIVPEVLPMIVIVVDEFADLMMQQGKEVEVCVARLAQKARAAGMHVILATQRPSVDVITGMIKANFPTRIAFRVAQKIDSRTILDEQGAEHLLGKGDMLIKLNGTNETKRVQCPWVSEEEVQMVTDFLRAQGEPVYDENILKPRDDDEAAADEDDAEQDPMYDDAVRIVADTRRCSTSWLQRKLGLGYNRAARIVETMERRGLVGPANGAKDREVLIAPV